jgi:CubicO group peptidase (beta-lactamase class C family)
MKRTILAALVLWGFSTSGTLTAQRPSVDTRAPAAASTYYPDRFDWQHKSPEQVGMDPEQIKQAVQQAIAADTPGPHDMTLFLKGSFGKEPFDTLIGPVKDRGPASGLIVHRGAIVAEWGDPVRADITNSVTKTFLTTVIGLAWQRGLIHDVNDYVRDYMPPNVDLFDAAHNRNIKWDHLLRQTSDWQGTLWDKPDWADRPVGAKPEDWPNRPMYEPGTHFKYNDVRVNVMALAALEVWRRPLPAVLREEVMDPIGASSTWRWYGYDNSWVDIDGQKMQSVSGGGHWGGGMFINAYDMARFGYLFLQHGKWKDRQIVPEKWIEMARKPGPDNDSYGYANWYLNTNRKALPAAPETAVRFVGNGSNIIYIDWENDLVVVVRWIRGGPALNDVIGKIIASTKTPAPATRSRGLF